MNVLAVIGSLRAHSSNAALLRALARVAPDGTRVTIYEGMGELPHFNPDLDGEVAVPPPAVRDLRERMLAAYAVVI